MEPRARVALAVGGGYLLGRTKKMRLALTVASLAAGRRMSGPEGLVSQGLQVLRNSPELEGVRGEVRQKLMAAGRTAALTAASNSLNRMTDRLNGGGALRLADGADDEQDDEQADEQTRDRSDDQADDIADDRADESDDESEEQDDEQDDDIADEADDDADDESDDTEDDEDEAGSERPRSSGRSARRGREGPATKSTTKSAPAKKSSGRKAPAKRPARSGGNRG